MQRGSEDIAQLRAETEEWRPVVGYEGFYEVSSIGRIRRIAWGRGTGNGRILRPALRKNHIHYSVSLLKGSVAERRYFMVHRLVVEAFIGRIPLDKVVNHINGIPTDNRVENLEIVTVAENNAHAVRMGLAPIGSRHYTTRLTESDVARIRELYTQGVGCTELGRRYGELRTTIQRIVRRKTWKHVP